MIRVQLPYHLRNLAKVQGEINLAVAPPVTLHAVLDALEAAYPVLKGTIREHATLHRRALNNLAEPTAGLRCEYSIWIDRRAFKVVNFPTRKIRAADLPSVPIAIRCKYKGPFFATDKNPNTAHRFSYFQEFDHQPKALSMVIQIDQPLY